MTQASQPSDPSDDLIHRGLVVDDENPVDLSALLAPKPAKRTPARSSAAQRKDTPPSGKQPDGA
ncbi:hypothetical protein [Actinoplanes missouriensis]|nr:hypothetical protein [Actinoplanes missouriensis]